LNLEADIEWGKRLPTSKGVDGVFTQVEYTQSDEHQSASVKTSFDSVAVERQE